MSSSLCFYYKAHHNWDWVVTEAVKQLSLNASNERISFHCISGNEVKKFLSKAGFSFDSQIENKKINSSHDLPSQQLLFKASGHFDKHDYSLLKAELINDTISTIFCVDTTNHELEFLDAKDNLFSIACKCHVQDCFPPSQLLSWDCCNPDDISDFPSIPAILKAPLGSGGFGLYFVYSKKDILEVIKGHKNRAEEYPGFLDGLKKDYGRIPSWTLQRYVPVVKIQEFQMCRCQIRAYVVLCDNDLFLYPDFEVRLPYWTIPLDSILASEAAESSENESSMNERIEWSDPVERQCVGVGRARPYNEGRDKKRTQRLLISEIAELVNANASTAVEDCVLRCFKGLKIEIDRRRKEEYSDHESPPNETLIGATKVCKKSIAVLGVDLVLCEKSDGDGFQDQKQLEAFIVEVNNNPAMPSLEKHHMSEKYKQHLISLTAAIIELGLMHNAIVN